jgi:hypothetical protein
VDLPQQVGAEAVMGILGDELEAALEIEAPGRGEGMIGP